MIQMQGGYEESIWNRAWALRVNDISRDFDLCAMIQMQGGFEESIWNGDVGSCLGAGDE